MILSCSKCGDYRATGAVYQDKRYGKGMRVHNRAGDFYICTICEHKRSGPREQKAKGEKPRLVTS